MAKPNKATQTKRIREQSKHERQQEKEQMRAIRSEQKKERKLLATDGYDPDLEGIVAGPQPRRDD